MGTACADHDAQNALKWGLAPHAAQGDVTNDLHIVIESLRNSFFLIHAHLYEFLMIYLRYDVHCSDDIEAATIFWQVLGVDADMLDDIVEVNPQWRGGFLYVAGHLERDPCSMEKVSGVLLYIFKWRKFTATRWTTVGASCRSFVASLCVGLQPWGMD